MTPRYSKEMPGAEQEFCSESVSEYAGEGWDIRISVGDAPLDEAFFFTVESLADADRSVRELLEQFALNPAREGELDIDSYPDLPFLQQELVQYYAAAQCGQFKLRTFVTTERRSSIWTGPRAKHWLAAPSEIGRGTIWCWI